MIVFPPQGKVRLSRPCDVDDLHLEYPVPSGEILMDADVHGAVGPEYLTCQPDHRRALVFSDLDQ